MKLNYYGTLGPACADSDILKRMFEAGMTGLRLNTSHGRLADAGDWIRLADGAAGEAGRDWELLIDLRGPELRIGSLAGSLLLEEGKAVILQGHASEEEVIRSAAVTALPVIPAPNGIFEAAQTGDILWLDDSKLKLQVIHVDRSNRQLSAKVLCGGTLQSGKSLAIDGVEVAAPALTDVDIENIRYAGSSGLRLAAVVQPFVRSREDLLEVRRTLDANGCGDTAIMAKIENMSGVQALPELLPHCDSVVIARGDLGTAVSLPMLPVVQKQIEKLCHKAGKPYMVVTQMLDSMMHTPVPTRAEVSDIAHAVYCGAASLMLTGETAAGRYPAEAMACLIQTAEAMERYIQEL